VAVVGAVMLEKGAGAAADSTALAASASGLVGNYGADSDDEDDGPSAKRARMDMLSTPPPPAMAVPPQVEAAAPPSPESSPPSALPPTLVAAVRRDGVDSVPDADASAMPPPSVVPARLKSPRVAGTSAKDMSSDLVVRDEAKVPGPGAPRPSVSPLLEKENDGLEGPAPLPAPQPQQLELSEVPGALSHVGAATATTPAAEEEADDGEEQDGNVAHELPIGFFDDPEQDAKARGVEAPSVVAERELEEGLKRFEKEMVVEQERAEETRQDIDERRYEDATAEEEAFQKTLHGRLERLRERAAARSAEVAKGTATDREAEASADAADETSDSDGSDIGFDWRSKRFG